jgi:lipopolysaccharide/colanic/teichoic acid biosynthesis glycosyltransferase
MYLTVYEFVFGGTGMPYDSALPSIDLDARSDDFRYRSGSTTLAGGGRHAKGKRVLDVAGSLAFIILASPLLAATGVSVWLSSGSPILFRQPRNGLNNKTFMIYKFRTMRNEPEVERQAEREDARVTALGRFLRRSSLDELPQFFNVLRGDMSLVGPRPHPVWLNDKYRGLIGGFDERHLVKPGITGLAQIRGYRGETRSVRGMARRVELDREYVRTASFGVDVKILLSTVVRFWFDAAAY